MRRGSLHFYIFLGVIAVAVGVPLVFILEDPISKIAAAFTTVIGLGLSISHIREFQKKRDSA